MDGNTLAKEKEARLAFTRAVYKATEANEHAFVNMFEIGESLELDHATTQRVMQYLNGEGILRYVALGGTIGITHAGIVEVESAIANPDTPTLHFPAVNFISIGTMTNSQLSQGSTASSQTQTTGITAAQLVDVAKFLAEFRQALPSLPLSDDAKSEAQAELQTADAQVHSSKPKVHILKESLMTMKEILKTLGYHVAAQELLKHLPQGLGLS